MRGPIRIETALLLALLRGPGYGLELIERVRVRSRGRIRLPQGAVYPALQGLERRKLLRRWTVNPPGTGRPRTYYELTPKGISVAQAERGAIGGFAASEAPVALSGRELFAMLERLFECGELAEAGLWLRLAGERAGL